MNTLADIFRDHKKEAIVWSVLIGIAATFFIIFLFEYQFQHPQQNGYVAWRAAFITHTTTVEGTVVNITNIGTDTKPSGTIRVQSALVDIQNPALHRFYKQSLIARQVGGAGLGGGRISNSFSLLKKPETLTIVFNSATQFTTKVPSSIHTGDIVAVQLFHSVYATNSPLTAKSVAIFVATRAVVV